MSNTDSNMQVELNNNTPSSVLGNGDGAEVETQVANPVETPADVDPNAVNVDPNAVNVVPGDVDPNAANVDPNAANGDAVDGAVVPATVPRIDSPDASKPSTSVLSKAQNYLSQINAYKPANTPANAQGKSILSSFNPSSFNPFTKAVAKTAEITGTARDGSLRINLYKVDNGFAAEVVPINGEAISGTKSLPVVADLLGKPDKLGIAAAVTNKQAGGQSRKRRTIRKNGGYNSARFFSVTKKRAHRNKSANKKQYVNKTIRK